MRYLTIIVLLITLVGLRIAHGGSLPATIQVLDTEEKWGGANPDDIKAVLDSVISALTMVIEPRLLGTIQIISSDQSPISIYAKGKNGEHQIQLNVKGTYWSQLIYQFSHELCHVLSNNELAPNNSTHQQWFEESLCESFSLMTLGKTAKYWEINPPYPHWQEYSANIKKYQQDLLNKPDRLLPDNKTLSQWYDEHKVQIEADPYIDNRALNNIVANQLYALFESEPNSWNSIKAINLGVDQTNISFDQFLNDWQNNSSIEQKRTVAKIRQTFLNH